jgi:reactive intermediate/imine deaminase
MIDVRGQVAFLTSATEGLGREIAKELVGAGMRIALFDGQEVMLLALADDLISDGGDILPLVVDLADADTTRQAIDRALAHFGAPRAVIHNAAALHEVSILDITFDTWRRQTNINLHAAFLFAKSVWQPMIEVGGGSIVFVSLGSAGTDFVKETVGDYGQERLMRALSREGKEHNIAVNTITTGAPSDALNCASHSEQMQIGMPHPSALAPVFAFLAGIDAGFATGYNFNAHHLSAAMRHGTLRGRPRAKSQITAQSAPTPAGTYSQAVRAGDFVFVSGQVPRASDGTYEPANIGEETRRALGNLSRIAEAAGGALSDAVKINAYLARGEYFAEFDTAYGGFFIDVPPARTTITVGLREVKVELDAVLYLPL